VDGSAAHWEERCDATIVEVRCSHAAGCRSLGQVPGAVSASRASYLKPWHHLTKRSAVVATHGGPIEACCGRSLAFFRIKRGVEKVPKAGRKPSCTRSLVVECGVANQSGKFIGWRQASPTTSLRSEFDSRRVHPLPFCARGTRWPSTFAPRRYRGGGHRFALGHTSCTNTLNRVQPAPCLPWQPTAPPPGRWLLSPPHHLARYVQQR
jgi:hypothetical protein